MKNILIIDAVSTGYNFAEDITARGCFPILMESHMLKGHNGGVKATYEKILCSYDLIDEAASFEETLALVRNYEPVLVLAGAESGVELATRLAESLGLPGNPTSILDNMRNKACMQFALKKAGLRYIPGCVVSNVSEAEKFIQSNHLIKGVVKPLSGASSNGVVLCDTPEQILNAVATGLTKKDVYGRPIDRLLVQERIIGTEFIVNTMSCGGRHRISSIYQYVKQKTEEGGYAYKGSFNLLNLEPIHEKLAAYALKTADAIGIQYGSIHGEYMIDEKGPVLIEVNCRPMGGSISAEYLDLLYGHHETDAVLDCYLDPGKFALDAEKPYHALRQGYIKYSIIPHEADVENIPLWTIAENLRSMFEISLPERDTQRLFAKTEDMETAGGQIFLVHDDASIVRSDAALLNELEDHYFSLMYSEGISRPWFIRKDAMPQGIREVMKDLSLQGTTLAVCEEKEKIPDILTVLPENIQDLDLCFDNIVLNLSCSLLDKRENEVVRLLFDIFKKTSEGGRVYITETTCRYLSCGRKGAEILLRVSGFEIEENAGQFQNAMVIGKRYSLTLMP